MTAPLDRYMDDVREAERLDYAARRAAEHGDQDTAARLRQEAERLWDQIEKEAEREN